MYVDSSKLTHYQKITIRKERKDTAKDAKKNMPNAFLCVLCGFSLRTLR
jgi:hypothetical protein